MPADAFHLAVEGGEDPAAQRGVQAKRITDRVDALPDLQAPAVTDVHRSESGWRGDAKDDEIMLWRPTNELGIVNALVREYDGCSTRSLQDVIVGDDVTGVVPQKTSPGTTAELPDGP